MEVGNSFTEQFLLLEEEELKPDYCLALKLRTDSRDGEKMPESSPPPGANRLILFAFCRASLHANHESSERLHAIISSQTLLLLPIYFKCNPSSTFKVSQPSHGQSFRSLCPGDGIVDCIFSLFAE